MTARNTRRRALLALLASCSIAACGQQQQGASAPVPAPAFDQALHDRLPAEVRARGVLQVATDASYAPASSFAADGRTIIGFEPDLAAELGRVLGVRFEFVESSFTDILPKLEAGQIDLGLSAITDTPARQQQADFVNYFSAGTSIVVRRGNPEGVTDLHGLCGHVVAVEVGTVQVDMLERSQRGCGDDKIDLHVYETNADALVQLRTGRAVAVLNDYPPAVHLTTDERTRADYQLASTTQYEPGFYGIAVAKDNPALRDVLRDALDQLIRNGTYTEVLRRWGVLQGGLESASINGSGAAASTG